MSGEAAARTCGGCAGPLVPHPGERPSAFGRRQFCGRACANKRAEHATDRTCAPCGRTLVPRGRESAYSFHRRRFCSRSCASLGRVGTHYQTRRGRTPRARKAPAPVVAPVVVEAPRAPWRPAGFASVPLGELSRT